MEKSSHRRWVYILFNFIILMMFKNYAIADVYLPRGVMYPVSPIISEGMGKEFESSVGYIYGKFKTNIFDIRASYGEFSKYIRRSLTIDVYNGEEYNSPVWGMRGILQLALNWGYFNGPILATGVFGGIGLERFRDYERSFFFNIGLWGFIGFQNDREKELILLGFYYPFPTNAFITISPFKNFYISSYYHMFNGIGFRIGYNFVLSSI